MKTVTVEVFEQLSHGAVLLFDERSCVREQIELSNRNSNRLIEILPRQWHTLVSLQSDRILFETKPGPGQQGFCILGLKENADQATEFTHRLEHAQIGEMAPILKA